ncbi:uncharacterized protein EV420DRAFT_1633661 [Desarmillaria tabescens]|uniref:BTB domain-containing protein n=1 Tax=Armillaria tabescens TaxID=1929756 RepID=A0AA39NPL3_ARMTA|nr:uncharacterized protein EV420DRAFT_1633661 [Desarmillaria tabescens]KAK0469238.1 hypothetical protein EV420DRAFT_1633661 [Desarmillaria tabescens]
MNEKNLDKMSEDDQVENLWIEAFGSGDSDRNLDVPSPGADGMPSTLSLPTSRNQKFYFDDDMTVFIVENELFRIHRYFLTRESEFFCTMLSCPPGSEGPEGTCDEKPIPIDAGATCKEFECVLDYIFNRRGNNTARHQTDRYWINILSFSNRFDLDDIRTVAVAHLQMYPILNPIDAIALAEQVDMKEWLLPAYKALCQRVEPLHYLEGEKIGLEKALQVARAREAVRDAAGRDIPITPSPAMPPDIAWSSRPSTPEPPPLYSDSLVTRVVKEVLCQGPGA